MNMDVFPKTNEWLSGAAKVEAKPEGEPVYPSLAAKAAFTDPNALEVIERMERAVALHGKELVRKINSSFFFQIYQAGGKVVEIIVDLSSGAGSVKFEAPWSWCTNTMTMTERSMVRVANGEMSENEMLYGGHFHITGIGGFAHLFGTKLGPYLLNKDV